MEKISEPSFFVLCSCEIIQYTLVGKNSMNNNKIEYFFFTCLLIISHCISPMDHPSGSWLYGSSTSSWTFNPISLVTGAASSLAATVHNKLSDEAALKKLGFPRNDSYAETELAECKTLYNNIINSEQNHQIKELLERSLRRTEYATRVFSILPERPDFHEIILHCTLNHEKIMPSILKNCYDTFLQEKLDLYKRLSEDIKQCNISQASIPKVSLPPSLDDMNPHSLQITIPTLAGTAQLFCDNASSLCRTAENMLSDTAAFKKLGWPEDDPEAQKELLITSTNYEKIEKTTNHQERINLLSFLQRRTEYLVRAFFALPHRAHSFEMAQFLMTHHQKAMFPLLITLFSRFTAAQRKAVESANEKLLKNSDSMMVNRTIDYTFGTASYKSLEEIKKAFEADSLVLLNQQHGIQGCIVDENNYRMAFRSLAGDFLVTNKPDIKLGILTADCLPIFFYDKERRVVSAAHAGWKGSVANIVKAVLECMNRHYDTKPTDVSIIFGPCIHSCCFSVEENIIKIVTDLGRTNEAINSNKIISKRDDTYFFDLLAFNKALLISLGVNEFAINSQYSKCTKCHTEYYSHRGGCQKEERQLSYVEIKK